MQNLGKIKGYLIGLFAIGVMVLLGVFFCQMGEAKAEEPLERGYSAEQNSIQEVALNKELEKELRKNVRSGGSGVDIGIISGTETQTLAISDLTNIKYIPFANYFLINPYHTADAEGNWAGLCTTIALQLLMGYHNYYSDRRIIPATLLNSDYGNLNAHPIFQRELVWGLGCPRIGTSSLFFYQLYASSVLSNFPGLGQAIGVVAGAGAEFINNNTPQYLHSGISLTSGFFSKSEAQSDIDAGRPIVLGMHPFNSEASFHVVVAYGYAKRDGIDGFLVHYGWGSDRTQVWVPASWFRFKMRMNVTTHTHNFVSGGIINNTHIGRTCSVCGAGDVDYLYNTSIDSIQSLRYPCTGTISIPESVNLYNVETASFTVRNISCIEEETFKNQTSLSKVILPSSINTIGDRAFKNCNNLNEVVIPSVTSLLNRVGHEAFAGCTSLSSIKLPYTVTQIGFLAFEQNTALDSYSGIIGTNFDLVVLDGTASSYGSWQNKDFNIVEISTNPLKVKSGQLRGDIEIPPQLNGQTITEINNNAFENQTQIRLVSVPTTVVKIGKNAFSGCSNLEYMVYWSLQDTTANVPDHSTSYTNYYYTERFTGVQLEAGFTYTLTFDYNNLQSSSARSDVFTNLGVGENCFALDITGGTHFSSSSSGTQTIVFTPTEAQLATSKKLWCRFIRTSTPQTVSINISNVQLYMGVKNVDVDAFNGCPKLASPGLCYRLQSDNTYAVEGTESGGWDVLFYALSRTLFIPSVYNGLPVTTIDPWAFREDEYMRWAFFQSGLTTIGNRAFQFCYDLESVNLSATSVTRFEDYTFDTCKLGTFKFPSTLTYIGEGAFIRAGIVGTIPESVTTIGDYAFSYRTVQTMTLPTNLVTIGNYAFYQTAPYGVNSIPATVTSVGSRAFSYSNFSSDYVLSPNSALYSIGSYAFNNSGITNIVLPSTVTSIGACAFGANSGLTIYTSYGSKPAGWNDVWNNNLRPVVWGCALSSDGSYVISFTKSASNPDNLGNGIINPIRRNYNFKGWYTTPDFSDTKYSTILEAPNGVLYAKWNEQSCVAEGTLITLADGTHVAVEDLTGEEELLVWNLLTGQFDSAPIIFVDSDPYTSYEITHLYFSDGTEVKVIDEHAFWDVNLNEYVFLRNDAAQYIGHWFNKQITLPGGGMTWTTVQLVDVDVYQEYTTAWSPVTFGHLCFYVNDMLSMPGATEGLINIFEVDSLTMSYDAEAFAADIAEYGLFTYQEFAALIPIPEEVFYAFSGQYLKVSIGKGLITLEEIALLIERYSVFFA